MIQFIKNLFKEKKPSDSIDFSKLHIAVKQTNVVKWNPNDMEIFHLNEKNNNIMLPGFEYIIIKEPTKKELEELGVKYLDGWLSLKFRCFQYKFYIEFLSDKPYLRDFIVIGLDDLIDEYTTRTEYNLDHYYNHNDRYFNLTHMITEGLKNSGNEITYNGKVVERMTLITEFIFD